MKKPLTKEALRREAGFWNGIKRAIKEHPARVCRK